MKWSREKEQMMEMKDSEGDRDDEEEPSKDDTKNHKVFFFKNKWLIAYSDIYAQTKVSKEDKKHHKV